jgi:hypothetical protein
MMKKVICILLAVFVLTDGFAQQSMWGAWERNCDNQSLAVYT